MSQESLLILIPAIIHLLLLALLPLRFVYSYRPPKNTETEKIPISLIMAAHNEAENLKKYLPLFLEQDHPNFEIILVLDRCTDDSLKIAGDLSLENEKLKLIEIEETPKGWDSKKYALNEAISKAKNEWLAFCDADCFPASAQWLSKMAKAIEPKVNNILGASFLKGGNSLLDRIVNFETGRTCTLFMSAATYMKPYMALGRNRMMRKSWFLKHKGFENWRSVKGGDDDILIATHSLKKDTAVVLSEDAITFSFGPMTFRNFYYQKVRHYGASRFYPAGLQGFLGLHNGLTLYVVLLFPFVCLSVGTNLSVFAVVYFSHFLLNIVIFKRLRQVACQSAAKIPLPWVEMLYLISGFIFSIVASIRKSVPWK